MFTNRIIKFIKSNKYPLTTSSILGFTLSISDDTPEETKFINIKNKINDYDINTLTQEICEKLIEAHPENIKNIPLEYITYKMCNDVINANPNNIKFIPDSFVTTEMCEKLFKIDVDFYFLFPKEKQTKEMLNKVIKHHKENIIIYKDAIYDIPIEIMDDEMIMYIVDKRGNTIKYTDLSKYQVSLSTQTKLNRMCEFKQYCNYDSYCNILRKNLKPQLARHE